MTIEASHRASDSAYVSRVWQGRVSGTEWMTSVATSTWELVFWTDGGAPHAVVRGPETAASRVNVAGDSDSFGITFAHGTVLPRMPVGGLVDSHWVSPHVSDRAFVLANQEWEVPGIDDAEALVDRLVRAGALVRDPMVSEVVWGSPATVGKRSVQRRVAASTGLTHRAIRQIERARCAAVLLGEGMAALEVVHRCGYYDQPHLARSLQRFIGRTASQLQQGDRGTAALSLLYKTDIELGS